jgi:hypothetical protein
MLRWITMNWSFRNQRSHNNILNAFVVFETKAFHIGVFNAACIYLFITKNVFKLKTQQVSSVHEQMISTA